MGIGNIGWTEFLVILAIALIFFGPRRLPGIAQTIGKTLREFQKALNEVKSEIAQADQASKQTRSYVRSMLPNPPAPPTSAAEIPEDAEPEVTGEGGPAPPASGGSSTQQGPDEPERPERTGKEKEARPGPQEGLDDEGAEDQERK